MILTGYGLLRGGLVLLGWILTNLISSHGSGGFYVPCGYPNGIDEETCPGDCPRWAILTLASGPCHLRSWCLPDPLVFFHPLYNPDSSPLAVQCLPLINGS